MAFRGRSLFSSAVSEQILEVNWIVCAEKKVQVCFKALRTLVGVKVLNVGQVFVAYHMIKDDEGSSIG